VNTLGLNYSVNKSRVTHLSIINRDRVGRERTGTPFPFFSGATR